MTTDREDNHEQKDGESKQVKFLENEDDQGSANFQNLKNVEGKFSKSRIDDESLNEHHSLDCEHHVHFEHSVHTDSPTQKKQPLDKQMQPQKSILKIQEEFLNHFKRLRVIDKTFSKSLSKSQKSQFNDDLLSESDKEIITVKFGFKVETLQTTKYFTRSHTPVNAGKPKKSILKSHKKRLSMSQIPINIQKIQRSSLYSQNFENLQNTNKMIQNDQCFNDKDQDDEEEEDSKSVLSFENIAGSLSQNNSQDALNLLTNMDKQTLSQIFNENLDLQIIDNILKCLRQNLSDNHSTALKVMKCLLKQLDQIHDTLSDKTLQEIKMIVDELSLHDPEIKEIHQQYII